MWIQCRDFFTPIRSQDAMFPPDSRRVGAENAELSSLTGFLRRGEADLACALSPQRLALPDR